MPINYLAQLDSNRSEGPEFAATSKPRQAKTLTRGKRRASIRKSTTSAKGKERADRKTSRKSMAKAKRKRKKARTLAQQRATAKMIRAAKRANTRGRTKAKRKARRARVSTPVRRKRRKARKSAPKPPKRRRKARRRAAEEWRGDSAGHARAARKGWRKRKARHGKRKARRTAKQLAAARRNIKKAQAARRRRGGSSKPRKRSATRRRAHRAAGTAHRASHSITPHKGPGLSSYGRRRRARRNPSQYGLTGGELFVASIFGTIGFLGGDAVDRLIATHSLTDKGTKDANGNELYADNPPATGSYQGLFNPTAICAPMDLARWAAGIGVPAATFVVANFVKAPMVRASMQFAAFGWGVRIVGKGAIDAIAMLTKGTGAGQRLYDGEMRAGVLKANNGNGQAAELASLPSAGLGHPQLGKPLGDCAPCAEKNGAGYPSMPRETASAAQTQTPTPPAQTSLPPAPPPPPPPAAPPPGVFTNNLTGLPKPRNRFNWGFSDE